MELLFPDDEAIGRVGVDMDGYNHVWISDLGCTMDISVDISKSF